MNEGKRLRKKREGLQCQEGDKIVRGNQIVKSNQNILYTFIKYLGTI